MARQRSNEPTRGVVIALFKCYLLNIRHLKRIYWFGPRGRFQFLGFMTTAAALLASGALGHSAFGGQTWLAVMLAVGVFTFGLACFLILGRQMVRLSARVAKIENRINALMSAEYGTPILLSWESDHQRRGPLQKLILGTFLRRI
jgi:hypothetical protein